jgi:hypothetical protein
VTTYANARESPGSIASYHVALAQVLKDVPLIYLYRPVNRYGVAADVAGAQLSRGRLIRPQFAGFEK